MKLIYRIALRLSLVLLPLMALWAGLFYYAIVDEINDESDDALEDYSELIITRMLAGRELPSLNSGSNNSYSIVPVDEAYARTHPNIDYYDADVYIHEKEETEPARIMTTIFRDADDMYYELRVAMPTFEREDLLRALAFWVVTLYLMLLVCVLGVTLWIFNRSMRPLYALLRWFDGYVPGRGSDGPSTDSTIPEFRQLNDAAAGAVRRSEASIEQQKQFIGNASHELQTPLAILGNRLEWILDNTSPDRRQAEEMFKMKRTLSHLVRLNKTLLLLSKIDNGQFPESSDVDLAALLREQVPTYDEIYEWRHLTVSMALPESFTVRMNDSLASTLVTNLLKNAYVHSPEGGTIEISAEGRTMTFSNDGSAPLDAERIFERFYQGDRKEGSTGLGLALVGAVCRYYGLKIDYRFEGSRHSFSISWPEA